MVQGPWGTKTCVQAPPPARRHTPDPSTAAYTTDASSGSNIACVTPPRSVSVRAAALLQPLGFGFADVVVVLMIEKRQAVENLEAILKVPGIDMVQFGASDFSMSIGKPAQYSDREVLEAETHVIKTALKKGKNPRVELRDPSQAEKYLAMGVKHFCIGWDVRILADWWDAKGAEMRKMLRSKPPKAKSAPSKAPARKGNGRDVVRGNYT